MSFSLIHFLFEIPGCHKIGILKGLIERFHVDKTILKGDLRDIILILIQ